MNPRQVWAVAKADFKERMRRPPIYMAMAVAAFLCYLSVIGQATVSMNGSRGVWNSAWSAGTMAVMATSFLTLICFFVIRSSVQRDEETGAGKLLAAAPISGFSYLLGKCLSNFSVLLVVSAVFVVAAPILQWHEHAGYGFDLWEFANPFLYVTVPAAAFVAAVAVLFECHPWLKRGLGNVLYIVAWTEMLRESGMGDRGWTDMVGFYGFMKSTHAAAQAQGIKLAEHSLNIGHAEVDHWSAFVWNGFAFNWHDVWLRAEWFAVAAALVLVATYFFKRFDPDTRPALQLRMPAFLQRKQKSIEQAAGKWETELLKLTSLQGRVGHGRFFGIVRAEMKLLLKSIPKFVYVVLGIANLIALMPAEKDGPGGAGVLAFLWIVPVLIWSQMGAREQAPYARPLIFSAPHSFLRQLPAEWMAGFLIALGGSAGVGLNLLIHRRTAHLMVWLSGAMFIASLAIACGTWSRSTRLFQGLYTGWWYLAMNNAPSMDFTGITGQRHAWGYAVTAALLFASAMAQRWWNTERAAALRVFGLFRGRPHGEKAVAM
jgi:hypothetical protein